MWSCLTILNVQKCRPIIRWLPCTSILSLFSSRLYSDQFIFTLRSLSYVHSHLPGYVLLSGFAFFLDFFTAFSRLYVHFYLLGSVFPFWLPENFGLFSWFSRLYIHMEEYRSLKTAKSSEVSRLRWVRMSPDFDEFGRLKTAISSESSGPRKSVLRRIKRPAIICPAREIHKSE